jgi:hypothetical protein
MMQITLGESIEYYNYIRERLDKIKVITGESEPVVIEHICRWYSKTTSLMDALDDVLEKAKITGKLEEDFNIFRFGD